MSNGNVKFKVYWETMDGNRHELFMKGEDIDDMIERATEYIKGMYMRSFRIVRIEESSSRGWVTVEDFESVKVTQ